MTNYTCEKLREWQSHAEDIYPFTMGLIVISTVTILPTIVLNALILTSVVRKQALHTPSNILTCNLAAANLGVALISIPLVTIWKLMELYHYDQHHVCIAGKVTFMLGSIFNGTSYVTILVAIVDRYLALVLHLRYLSVVTVRRVSKSCLIIWFISLLSIITLYNGPGQLYNISIGICMILLLAVIAFCYSQIFTIIRRHHHQIASQEINNTTSFPQLSRYRKSVFNLFYVMCCQFIFITPSMISMIALAFRGVSIASLRLWSVGTGILYLNPLVNPLLIFMRYGELRVAVQETICYFWAKLKQEV